MNHPIAGVVVLVTAIQLQLPLLAYADGDTCDFASDPCPTKFDGNCDAGVGGSCEIGSDCHDCDSCGEFDRTSCEECTSNGNGCMWCQLSKVCSQAAFDPPEDQDSYQSSCRKSDFQSSCSINTTVNNQDQDQQEPEERQTISKPVASDFMCDWTTDACALRRQFNSKCQAGQLDENNEKELCPSDSDCFDCSTDPCRTQDFTSCDECTSKQGCLWCRSDSVCSAIAFSRSMFAIAGTTAQCSEANYVSTCDARTNNVFDDPLYDAQSWIYNLINVEPVWRQNITGKGVRVRVNDNGVDVQHADFAKKFDADASCEWYTPISNEKDHGTSCASIAVAHANNGECSVGIASGATLSSCRVYGSNATRELDDDFTFIATKVDQMDISSNSWGIDACRRLQKDDDSRGQLQQPRWKSQENCPFSQTTEGSPCSLDVCNDFFSSKDCETSIVDYCEVNYEVDVAACIEVLDLFVSCEYETLSEGTQKNLIKGITEGRDGKGIIYIFAAGNRYEIGADTNFEGWLNTRFTIAVGAVGKRGIHASYSTSGAALFVSAPGGDLEYLRGFLVAKPGGGCKDAGIGTSFAVPIVTGVVALLLEVNSNLGWRDVQGILASTSQMTDPEDSSWVINAAGFHHSYKYGFGIVDAQAAVTATKNWEQYPSEKQVVIQSGRVDLPILDDKTPVSSVLDVPIDIVAESVVVYLELHHSSRGDLDVILISPSGTQSVLHPSMRPETTTDDERWKLMTVRNWGENAHGLWTLSIVDEKAIASVVTENGEGDVEVTAKESDFLHERLVSWKLYVYGHDLPLTASPSSGRRPVGEMSDPPGSSPSTTYQPTIPTSGGISNGTQAKTIASGLLGFAFAMMFMWIYYDA